MSDVLPEEVWNPSDGGPAHPCQVDYGSMGAISYTGLSMRDYFADQVVGHLAKLSYGGTKVVAEHAYQIADAMLEERAK